MNWDISKQYHYTFTLDDESKQEWSPMQHANVKLPLGKSAHPLQTITNGIEIILNKILHALQENGR